jgi:hypothetical protein
MRFESQYTAVDPGSWRCRLECGTGGVSFVTIRAARYSRSTKMILRSGEILSN